ncbi:hypothetical protein OVA07_14650 [Novosphingobium sp. SL115]|uniref:hypothetical protein n=1 Tax=Novosphingobium sp. SL115 TaxID=2995150 RepID=UPI0022742F61|nr:hypothetical protein [Novosphingobium sp. SL115]MCY1672243.1 hypothetical protein [Novosphingobium sp. SL115]
MSLMLKVLAPLAVLQMASPAPAQASFIMVASCAGGMVPLRVPGKNNDNNNLPCCKVCHISMRKRLTTDSCCGEEDDGDVV